MNIFRIIVVAAFLAIVASAVVKVRLLTVAVSRQVHLLASQKQSLEQKLWQQELELARLRAPWQIAERVRALGLNLVPPGTAQGEGRPEAIAAGSTSAETTGNDTAHMTGSTAVRVR